MEMETIKYIFDIIGACFIVYLIGYSTFLFLSVVIGATTLYNKKMQDRTKILHFPIFSITYGKVLCL